MPDDVRHPVIADTSSLIAIANTDYWPRVATDVTLTTTNVCRHELRTHVQRHRYPPKGSREHYLKTGAQRALDQLDTDGSTLSCVTVVPRPHGANAGEQSLRQEIAEHPGEYEVVSILDTPARRSLRRLIQEAGFDIDVVGPPYLLYILLANDRLSREEFCEATAQMIRTEGWAGYEPVKSAWASIPVDCFDILGDEYDDVLPPR